MGFGDALAAGVALGLGAVAVGAAAWRASGRLVGRDPLDRSLVALVLGLAGLVAVVLVLGIVHLLYRWPVTLALVAVSGLVLWRVPALDAAPVSAAPHRTPDLLVAVAVGGGMAVLALELGLQGFSASPDTLQYHAVNAGTWLHHHSLLTLPPAVPGFPTNGYPSNHTLTGLWLMLGTGSDQLAYIVNVIWGALAVLGTAAATRALGGRAAAGALVALGVLLSPAVFGSQVNSLLSDIAAGGGVVAALAAGLRALDGERGRQWALVCGLALGLAVGSKITAAVPGAAVLGLLLFAKRDRAPMIGIVVAAAAPLVAFWLIRDAVEFGNPLFPLSAGPLHGLSSPLTQLEDSIAKQIARGNGTVVARWLRLARDVLGFAFLLPFAAALTGVWAWRRGNRPLLLAAGVAVAGLLTYLVTPYSGGGPHGISFLIGSSFRYESPALLLAAAVVAALHRRVAWATAAALLVFGAYKLRHGLTGRADVDVTTARSAVAVVSGLAIAALWGGIPRRALGPPAVAAVAGVLVVAIAGALQEQSPRPPTQTERLLAARCPGGRVAFMHVSDLRDLMGRRFEVAVQSVDLPAPAGRRPILDAGAANRRIAELHPALLAESDALLQPKRWHGPPGWRPVGGVGGATLLAPPQGCSR
jgi:hypothetical protein